MITKKIVAEELAKFKLNYMLNIENKTMELYTKYLLDDLNTENFTDNDFKTAMRTIKRNNPNMYGKMPNLAMFIEARPPKPYNPPIAIEKPKQIKKKITEKEKKQIDRALAKLKGHAFITGKQKEKQKQDWDEFKRNNPINLKNNPPKKGVLSPQLQKLKEQNK